jgi:hypothetical protein
MESNVFLFNRMERNFPTTTEVFDSFVHGETSMNENNLLSKKYDAPAAADSTGLFRLSRVFSGQTKRRIDSVYCGKNIPQYS